MGHQRIARNDDTTTTTTTCSPGAVNTKTKNNLAEVKWRFNYILWTEVISSYSYLYTIYFAVRIPTIRGYTFTMVLYYTVVLTFIHSCYAIYGKTPSKIKDVGVFLRRRDATLCRSLLVYGVRPYGIFLDTI